eukprot:jgi/Ulvmu1/11292/UM074_0007.1
MYLLNLSICIAINWIAFVPAAVLQTDAFYDATGSLTALVTLALCWRGMDPKSALMGSRYISILLVCTWVARLGSFLVYRIHKLGHDSRMDKMKRQPSTFFIAWTAQGIWIFVITLPVQALAFSDGTVAMNTWRAVVGIAGLTTWASGFLMESVADWQKLQFRLQPANKGKFITTGLFQYARYPNYCGEIMLWAGLALFSASRLASPAEWAVVACSPIFTYLLLSYVSGVPLQERQAKKRWGNSAEYARYKASTRLLLPLPKL